jgi:hypothetical protein
MRGLVTLETQANEETKQLSPRWEKLRVIAFVLASVLTPVVIAVVGQTFSKAEKEREIGVRYVELATNILRTEPKQSTRALRSWAVSVIDHYSEVPLSKQVRNELELEQLMFMFEVQSKLQKQQVELESIAEKAKRLHDEAVKAGPKLDNIR